jgi:hypothetical protein
MESERAFRPRVSRETRLLLVTALLAAAALWTLARVQPGGVTTPTSLVAPVLSPFTSAQYDGLASEVARVSARLRDVLVPIPAGLRGPDGRTRHVAGLRMGPTDILFVEPGRVRSTPAAGLGHVARDPASGLTLLRASEPRRVGLPVPWIPPADAGPRYLVGTSTTEGQVALRPIFAHALTPVPSALWPGLWTIAAADAIETGTVLFTLNGELVGLVLDDGGTPVVLPAAAALDAVGRLSARQGQAEGRLDIQVQALTPRLERATGASEGVAVTWVAPSLDAGLAIIPGQVIDQWNGMPIRSPRDWKVHASRLLAGEAVRLGMRAAEGRRDVTLRARASPSQPEEAHAVPQRPRALGLTLRRVPGAGSVVTRAAAASAASEAGLAANDLVTRVGAIERPTPGQVAAAFAQLPSGTALLVAVTRGPAHLLTTLEK